MGDASTLEVPSGIPKAIPVDGALFPHFAGYAETPSPFGEAWLENLPVSPSGVVAMVLGAALILLRRKLRRMVSRWLAGNPASDE